MVDIRPFCAYRFAPGKENRIPALPYDVYNREEARELLWNRIHEGRFVNCLF